MKAHFFRVFTSCLSKNMQSRAYQTSGVIIKLAQKIQADIESIQTDSVHEILRGFKNYQFSFGRDSTSRQLVSLSNELNSFIVTMAMQNPNLVATSFLATFLSIHSSFERTELRLRKDQQEQLFGLLESKTESEDAILDFDRKNKIDALFYVASRNAK